MTKLLIAVLVLVSCVGMTETDPAQTPNAETNPALASGTLNLVLANKNGIVIAADSRMSSDAPFLCAGVMQNYCDNSQKLFRTGDRSAMVVAGFAVGRGNSPLDLSLASVLRKRFGTDGLPGERGEVAMVTDWAKPTLEQSLTGVAALFDPTRKAPEDLILVATFIGFNKNGMPVVKQQKYIENWVRSGPLSITVPDYQVVEREITVERFAGVYSGIACVADAILHGYYKSDDPVIRSYYEKRRHEGLLDDAPLDDLKTLAKVILRETRNFTGAVGGEDQIGIFPVNGKVQWSLPALPSDKDLPARFYLWRGVECVEEKPCKYDRIAFTEDWQHSLDEPIAKFFLAGQFKGIAVALDNNYFVRNSFDGVTFKWQGGGFPYLLGNTFSNCVLELPEHGDVPKESEISGKCKLVRESKVVVESTTVGAPIKWEISGCATKNPNGGVTISAGGACGSPLSSVQGLIPQP